MNSTLSIDGAGRIVLPSELRRRFNLQAGSRLRLSVVAGRIELVPEAETGRRLTVSSATGRPVLQPTGKRLDAAAAVREERDAQARGRGRA